MLIVNWNMSETNMSSADLQMLTAGWPMFNGLTNIGSRLTNIDIILTSVDSRTIVDSRPRNFGSGLHAGVNNRLTPLLRGILYRRRAYYSIYSYCLYFILLNLLLFPSGNYSSILGGGFWHAHKFSKLVTSFPVNYSAPGVRKTRSYTCKSSF